jgi:hypothetical protein
MGGSGTPPVPGCRQRTLAAILCFWVLPSCLAIGGALQSDWAPSAELPR